MDFQHKHGTNSNCFKGYAMAHKDNDRTGEFTLDEKENDYNEQYSIWKKDRDVKFGNPIPKMSQKTLLKKFGIGFLILIILLILLFARIQSVRLENRIVALENRLYNTEETVNTKNAVDENMAQLLEKAQAVDQLRERLDQSEEALTSKMNQIVKEQDRLKQQIAKVRIQKPTASTNKNISPITDGSRYHVVKRGETLYQIGRQYGLTVQKVRLLNKLGDGDAIYPGQRLLVKP